jgi:hypothetical protein
MSEHDFVAYSIGFIHASVCTTITDDAAVEQRMNATHPTGIASPWRISKEPTFRDGVHHNGGPCNQDPRRRHLLMEC